MARKASNVVSLDRARLLREALRALHSPETRAIVYDGARGEFKRLVAPVLRKILSAKGAPLLFQRELIVLLETIYATQHVNREPDESKLHGRR